MQPRVSNVSLSAHSFFKVNPLATHSIVEVIIINTIRKIGRRSIILKRSRYAEFGLLVFAKVVSRVLLSVKHFPPLLSI